MTTSRLALPLLLLAVGWFLLNLFAGPVWTRAAGFASPVEAGPVLIALVNFLLPLLLLIVAFRLRRPNAK